jgi:hypothetical protein
VNAVRAIRSSVSTHGEHRRANRQPCTVPVVVRLHRHPHRTGGAPRAQRNVEIERRGYMIAKRRAEEGAVTEVDPAQAAAALIFTRADAPVLAPGF